MSAVRPRTIELSDRKPAGIKRLPLDVANPLYGVLTMGPSESATHVTLLLDAPPGRPSRLYVDANGNGDFTDDPRPQWEAKPYNGGDGRRYMQSTGGMTVSVQFGNIRLPLHLTLQRYDTSDPARTGYKGAILYSPDYAREGDMKFGAKVCRVMLLDALVGGDFRGLPGGGATGIFLLIDVNGNGVFDTRGEMYSAGQPFTIGGITYELRGLTASGESVEVVKSGKNVPEILPPPDLRVGKVVPAFDKRALDGSLIHFPGAYRGKLVLLYFWASWCGDCRRETPGVVAAYKAFHGQGLDIVGVSMDHANAAAELTDYTHRNGIPWPQIYDGGWMQAALAQLYYVQHIPTPILVDGNTGQVVAIGQELEGDRLRPTLMSALKSHRK